MVRGIRYLGGNFESLAGKVTIERIDKPGRTTSPSLGLIYIRNSTTEIEWAVVHEFGHMLTYNNPASIVYFMDELGSSCTFSFR